MTAVHRDLTIEEGATLSEVWTHRAAAGAAIDLTGFTARMTIRETWRGGEVFILTTENGRITLGGSAGTVTLSLTAAETASIDSLPVWYNQPDGVAEACDYGGPVQTYRYDLELVSAAGVVTRAFQGLCLLRREITEPI